MAFSLVANYAITESTNLTNGNPFRLAGAEGVSSPPVIRFEQRSPLQDGATDLGFRLDGRTLVLNIYFSASSASILDTYRQTLHTTFKPSQVVTMVLTRDDGGVRYLQVVRTDEIAIDLVPENRPGNLHRAIVKLRAPKPQWYGSSIADSFTMGTTPTWYTAGGLIPSANVLTHIEYPLNGDGFLGTATGGWTVVYRAGSVAGAGTMTVFHGGTGAVNAVGGNDARLFWDASGPWWAFAGGTQIAMVSMNSGTNNYMVMHDVSSGTTHAFYINNDLQLSGTVDYDISGTTRWRSDRLSSPSTYYTGELPKAAAYNIALSNGQRSALNAWMSDTPTIGTINAVNGGDFIEYPYITIQGPIASPVLTNATTGAVLDFTGVYIGSSEVYRIDLRTGSKTITNASGSVVVGNAVTPVELARFNLAPSPIAAGGTNVITVQGGSVAAITNVTVTHYDRYMSY